MFRVMRVIVMGMILIMRVVVVIMRVVVVIMRVVVVIMGVIVVIMGVIVVIIVGMVVMGVIIVMRMIVMIAVFLVPMIVIMHFEQGPFTEIQQSDPVRLKQCGDRRICGQSVHRIFHPRGQILTNPKDQIGALQRLRLGRAQAVFMG